MAACEKKRIHVRKPKERMNDAAARRIWRVGKSTFSFNLLCKQKLQTIFRIRSCITVNITKSRGILRKPLIFLQFSHYNFLLFVVQRLNARITCKTFFLFLCLRRRLWMAVERGHLMFTPSPRAYVTVHVYNEIVWGLSKRACFEREACREDGFSIFWCSFPLVRRRTLIKLTLAVS